MPPQEGQKKKFGAFGVDPSPQNLKLEKDGFENFGGVWRGGGSGIRTGCQGISFRLGLGGVPTYLPQNDRQFRTDRFEVQMFGRIIFCSFDVTAFAFPQISPRKPLWHVKHSLLVALHGQHWVTICQDGAGGGGGGFASSLPASCLSGV